MANERILNSTLKLSQRYPLFDRRLLEVCHAIDSRFKISSSHDRALIRGAADPLLPAIIAERHDKTWYAPDYRRSLKSRISGIEKARASATTKYHNLFDQTVIGIALRRQASETANQRNELEMLTSVAFPFFIGEFLKAEERGT
jgi:hypothetical protein